MQPPTAIQTILGYTQLPGAGAFRLLFEISGSFIDALPSALGFCLGVVGFAVAFLIQVGFFALPVWLVCRWWELRTKTA